MLPIKDILELLVTKFNDILHTNLVGMYLHGSLVMGCFNLNHSDIDFLVVVKEKLSFDTMRELINILLQITKDGPQKGFEMSIMLLDDAVTFTYPTPFILHYSEYHKERYLNDSNYICGGFEDPDLAAHITIIKERGSCLYGEPIDKIFETVPRQWYIESITNDVATVKNDILDNPTYYILNLCRIVYYLKEGAICSKKEGGKWGYNSLPEKYKDIIESALLSYSGTDKILDLKSDRLYDFTDFMIKEIEYYRYK